MAADPGPVARVRMHPKGPEFSGVVWGSMRSEEQFETPAKLADFLRFLLDRGITTLDTANTYGIPHPYSTEEFFGDAVRSSGVAAEGAAGHQPDRVFAHPSRADFQRRLRSRDQPRLPADDLVAGRRRQTAHRRRCQDREDTCVADRHRQAQRAD